MRIDFFGHAACALTSNSGARLLIDPYEPGGFGGKISYPEIHGDFEAVVCTHDHLDHNAVHAVKPVAPPRVEEGKVGPFLIERIRLDHDEYRGQRRGGTTDALMIHVDGLCILHLGDVGQAPNGQWPIAHCDVLLVPIGGFFTIGAFQAREWIRRSGARLTIPIHYHTASCDLKIRGLETFLALEREYKWSSESYILVTEEERSSRVVVIEPPRVKKTEGGPLNQVEKVDTMRTEANPRDHQEP